MPSNCAKLERNRCNSVAGVPPTELRLQTDGPTDRQAYFSIPPPKLRLRGYNESQKETQIRYFNKYLFGNRNLNTAPEKAH